RRRPGRKFLLVSLSDFSQTHFHPANPRRVLGTFPAFALHDVLLALPSLAVYCRREICGGHRCPGIFSDGPHRRISLSHLFPPGVQLHFHVRRTVLFLPRAFSFSSTVAGRRGEFSRGVLLVSHAVYAGVYLFFPPRPVAFA